MDSLKISNTAGRVSMGGSEGGEWEGRGRKGEDGREVGEREGEDGRERRKSEDGEVGGRKDEDGRDGGKGRQEG